MRMQIFSLYSCSLRTFPFEQFEDYLFQFLFVLSHEITPLVLHTEYNVGNRDCIRREVKEQCRSSLGCCCVKNFSCRPWGQPDLYSHLKIYSQSHQAQTRGLCYQLHSSCCCYTLTPVRWTAVLGPGERRNQVKYVRPCLVTKINYVSVKTHLTLTHLRVYTWLPDTDCLRVLDAIWKRHTMITIITVLQAALERLNFSLNLDGNPYLRFFLEWK